MLSPAQYYNQQRAHYARLLAKTIKEFNRIAALRLWAAVIAIGTIIWAFRSSADWHWWLAAILIAVFLALVRQHTRLSESKGLLQLHLSIIDNELQSLQGNNSAFANGAIYTDVAHPYSYDLDLFGKGSIYQSICRNVTVGGAALLAGRLCSLTFTKEVITGRQDIVKELSQLPELLQNFRVAGTANAEGPKDQRNLAQWLREPDLFINNMAIRIAAVLMPVTSVAFIVWSVITGGFYPGLYMVMIVNWILLGIFQKKFKLATMQMGNCAQLIGKYESLMKHTAGSAFKNEWLQKVKANAGLSLGNINSFKKIAHLFESRNNTMTGPIMNTFFLFDFYCLLRLEAWRKDHKQSLLTAMDDVIEMDVYVSCGVYAFNHPENIYATITTGTGITAKDLRHPLLPMTTAVGNDVSLGDREEFYLLTGANMTGKSTFIRTIGITNILTNIGLPSPAKELSIPLLGLYTSMRITDSVQDDISYFRAELNRIRAMMDIISASQQPYLVLLDEPLRGTNSTDKQQGTRAIVETLITYNAVGIIATHDTGLCDMEASHPGKISNYYFESKVELGELTFDFSIKRGGSTSNNATILMRQMGIIH